MSEENMSEGSMPEENVASNPAQKPKGLSIAGMVLGIVGLIFSLATCTWIFGIILCVIGLILSGVALNNCKQGKADGKGMAIAGLATSIVGIVWVLIFFIFVGSLVATGASAIESGEFNEALKELDSLMDKYDSY